MSSNSQFFKRLVPFVGLVVGAFLCLAQFRKVNYTHGRGEEQLTRELLEKAGASSEGYQALTADSLIDEYEKTLKTTDLDSWKNIRGPRQVKFKCILNSREMAHK